jgi:hypothetical protein
MGNSAIGRGTAVEEQKVKASSADASPGFLDSKVDGSTITVVGDQLVASAAPGFDFIQSSTFTTATTVDITQTFALTDVYKIVFQGCMVGGSADFQPVIRIGNDASGNNYRTVNTGQLGATTWTSSPAASNEIRLLNTGTENVLLDGAFIIEIDYMHDDPGVPTLSYTVSSTRGSPATAPMKSSGVAVFNGGPNPQLSIQLIRIAGTDTMTGRYYVQRMAKT